MHFQCIAYAAFGKIHMRRNQPHISSLSRPNPIVWTNQSDRLPAFTGTRLSLFRENKREQIGKNGQFLFPDCLSKKKNEKKIEAPTRSNILPGNERTSSADSARSAVCNSPQSKSAAPPSSELNARAIGKCTYLPTYPPT